MLRIAPRTRSYVAPVQPLTGRHLITERRRLQPRALASPTPSLRAQLRRPSQGSRYSDNISTLTSEADRDGFADAATGPGYERHFSVKPHRHQREKKRWALSFRTLAF